MILSQEVPAGWYPDPAGTTQLRYWDGATWTQHLHGPTAHVAPETTVLPSVPPPVRRRLARRALVPLAVVLVWLLAFPVMLYEWRAHHSPRTPGYPPPTQPVDAATAAKVLRTGGRPGEPVISPTQARLVLDTLWPLREHAITSGDVTAVSELESGPAEWGDLIRARTRHGVRHQPGSYREAVLFVPRQASYPARFVAEVATTQFNGSAWVELMVFVRSTAATPWTLDLDSGWTQGSPPSPLRVPLTDAAGFDTKPTATTQRIAREAPAQLATYWQQAKNSGSVPSSSLFAPGAWTTDRAAQLAQNPQDTVQTNGLMGHMTVSTQPGTFHGFLEADGAELTCGVLWTTVVNTGSPGGNPYQPRDRSNWGSEVPPGVYDAVTTRYQWQTCFSVPPTGKPVTVLGGDGITEARSSGIGRH